MPAAGGVTVLGVVLARTTRDAALVVPPRRPADLRTGQHETSQPGNPLSHNGIRARRYTPPMHMSASILGRWLSLVGRGDRSVTGWQRTVSTGRPWTICLVWSTWKFDVAFARVAVADGRSAGPPAALLSHGPRPHRSRGDPRYPEGAGQSCTDDHESDLGDGPALASAGNPVRHEPGSVSDARTGSRPASYPWLASQALALPERRSLGGQALADRAAWYVFRGPEAAEDALAH